MAKPSEESLEKYSCPEGKELLVCDLCGLLFCGLPKYPLKDEWSDYIPQYCHACHVGGLE